MGRRLSSRPVRLRESRRHEAELAWTRARFDAEAAEAVISALVQAHRRTIALARQLMIAQEIADAQEARAYRAVARAAVDPRDTSAVEEALRASAVAESADRDEAAIAAGWGEHVLRVALLIDQLERASMVRPVGERLSSDSVLGRRPQA